MEKYGIRQRKVWTSAFQMTALNLRETVGSWVKGLRCAGGEMENGAASGHQVQILKTDGCSFELDTHALARVLLNDRVKDKPVVVVAIVGAFRKGKSFLLSFLVRYLQNMGRADWLAEPDVPLEGFEWRGGSQRHTEGIAVWSEAFLGTTSEGREVAVLLMDTQGTFDCRTTAQVHSVIFALSTLVSSVLVYNVSQNIQEDDLQHLQLFIDYGCVAQRIQQKASTEPFQSLLFLVRDWCFPYEANYGADGGKMVLNQRLEISDDQADELRQLREKIRSFFSKIGCFLMPHPGRKVTTEQLFDGRLSSIDEEFKQQLENLVLSLLAPENLLAKTINGREISCQELMAYFQATMSGTNLAAMQKALDLYISKMLKVWEAEERVDREIMLGHHYRLREEAIELFERFPRIGGEVFELCYRKQLLERIDEVFQRYSPYMMAKKNHWKDITGSLAFKAVHATMTAGLGAAAIVLGTVMLPEAAIACALAGAASVSMHVYDVIKSKREEQRKAKECNGPAESASTANDNSDDSAQQSTNETFENFVNQDREGQS
ncbi:atlastin-1-like isoform X2 [Amblyomma americanum]